MSEPVNSPAERLNAYRECERKILRGGQQVRAPDGRMTTMADIEQVRAEIKRLESQVAAQRRGGIGVSYATFHDGPYGDDFRRGRY